MDGQTLLTLWERNASHHPVDRALGMLTALTNRPMRDLVRLDIGQRDALLLRCRARMYSETIAGIAHCPLCACAVEVALRPPDDLEASPGPIQSDGWFTAAGVDCRLPTSLDLAAIAGCEGIEDARALLRTRCVRSAGTLDEAAYTTAEAAIAERAGLSALTVDIECPSCLHKWGIDLDIASFLWDELKVMAARLLREVDVLARRYGWSEREILGLSGARRQHYLELAE